MKPVVKISLDVTSIPEAIETAHMALRAGVDWLEAGTPLIIAEGMNGVRALRLEFPDTPIVADLKTMDGGWLEAELMARAGASHVVVMARAHEETIKCVVKAGRDMNIGIMGDNLGCPDMVAGAKLLEDLGCDYVIHHIGYDERRGIAARGEKAPTPLDQLREVVQAVSVPVQAVGGLTLEQAVRTPEYGAPLVVLGMTLYNNARNLPDAIESLLAQTFSQFTLVLLDDASSDDTEAVARRYAARDSRVRYFRHDRRQAMIATWREVGAGYHRTLEKAGIEFDSIPLAIRERTQEIMDQNRGMSPVRALYRFVRDSVRYNNFEFSRHALVPEKSEAVLVNGFLRMLGEDPPPMDELAGKVAGARLGRMRMGA